MSFYKLQKFVICSKNKCYQHEVDLEFTIMMFLFVFNSKVYIF